MDNDLRPGNNRTLLIGLATLVLFALVTLGAWAFLDVTSIARTEPAIPDDASDSFDALTGSEGDTARVVSLGTLSPELDESSGVAVSRRYDGVVWSHNDGDDPVLYALRPDGTLLSRISVEVDDTEDWEDIALGPCPPESLAPAGGDCLYVGDVGDNDAERESMMVVVLREPDPGKPGTVPVLGTIRFRYPDGPADTEALAVSPGGDILLVTKGEDGNSRLYQLSPGLDGGVSGTRSSWARSRPRRTGTKTASPAPPSPRTGGRWPSVAITPSSSPPSTTRWEPPPCARSG